MRPWRHSGRPRPSSPARSGGSWPGPSRHSVVLERMSGWLAELRANLAEGDLAVADIDPVEPERLASRGARLVARRGPRRRRRPLGPDRRRTDRSRTRSSTQAPGTARRATRRAGRGACEEALVGTPVADPARPLEILRTVHSFDPCLACGVHAFDPAALGASAIRTVPGGCHDGPARRPGGAARARRGPGRGARPRRTRPDPREATEHGSEGRIRVYIWQVPVRARTG